MSCYVVDKKVIDLIVSWIMNRGIQYKAENYHYEGFYGKEKCHVLGYTS